LNEPALQERLVALLRRCHDSQRLVQKFVLGRGNADDLLALSSTILASRQLVVSMQDLVHGKDNSIASSSASCLSRLASRIQLDGPLALASRIKDAIDEEGVQQQHQIEDGEAGTMMALAHEIATSEVPADDLAAISKDRDKKPALSLREQYAEDNQVWIMKPSANAALRRLHNQLGAFEKERVTLNCELQKTLSAPTLTLRWTPSLGHICHVKGRDAKHLTEIRSVSSSKSTRSFHHPEWTNLGQSIDMVRLQIRAEEQKIFRKLREMVIENLIKLRRNAAVLDELDIACSFATLAKEQRLVRPVLNNTTVHKIIGGRHPTVQVSLQEQGRSFVTNDCFVGDQGRMWIITGPNMGGKSTFLRQNALITIMAQVGSFVPAEYAEIGIVDQVFSRIGSADDLYRHQSTFMVEMLETATILKRATERSFVIMDEIGRGTTPQDGIAVAFACLHHLYHVNNCRTLFATHFHTLGDLSQHMDRIAYWCTNIAEDKNGGFNYLHKLKRGINRESHALKVAKLAGIPDAAIDIARQVLDGGKPIAVVSNYPS
jgi:DNA mismatch repair ATPase MutS